MTAKTTISKCVILARGLGTRMRRDDASASLDPAQSATAGAGLKAMMPIGRPFLDYVLSALADSGFKQACLVIGPEHEAVRKYYTKAAKPQRIEVSFAIQREPLGTANAVLAAAEFAGDHEFLVINSDNYYPAEALGAIQNLGQPGTALFTAKALVRESNIPAERIRAFADCVVDQDGFLADIVEKPDSATAANLDREKLVSMNCWRFAPDIFAACRDVPLSPRSEYELPSAVKLAIQRGAKFKVAVSRTGVLDLSRRSDIAAVAARLKDVKVHL
jgi:glucose-1-phosphate thymidylyltransferase